VTVLVTGLLQAYEHQGAGCLESHYMNVNAEIITVVSTFVCVCDISITGQTYIAVTLDIVQHLDTV